MGMSEMLKIVGLFLVITVAVLWVAGNAKIPARGDVLTAAVGSAPEIVPSVQEVKETVPSSDAPGDGYAEIEGMVILDTLPGSDPVPFLQYTSEGKVRTKQLIFANSRGCLAGAGDIPCVSTDQDAAYPHITQGARVMVRGMIKADRLLVYDLEPA